MDTNRLKSLRVKQFIFINACVCILIPLVGCLLLVLEPSPSDTYLLGAFLYGALLLSEFWSLFQTHQPSESRREKWSTERS